MTLADFLADVSISISTHTPLARRDVICVAIGEFDNISTHTPLARRDNRDGCLIHFKT